MPLARAASIIASALALAPHRLGASTLRCEISTGHCAASPMSSASLTAPRARCPRCACAWRTVRRTLPPSAPAPRSRTGPRKSRARIAGRSKSRPRRRASPAPRAPASCLAPRPSARAARCPSRRGAPCCDRRGWRSSPTTPVCSIVLNAVATSSAEPPQLPATTVVTPMRTKCSARGWSAISSACVCTSMKPGATTRPSASITVCAVAPGERADRGDLARR